MLYGSFRNLLGGHTSSSLEAALEGSVVGISEVKPDRFTKVTVDRNVEAVNGPREYHSPLREERARQTRTRVLEAARILFMARGYAPTTITAVAQESRVSVHTIYGVFGSKIGLLKALLDMTVGGDDQDVSLLERSGPQAMREATDQRRQLGMFAAGMAKQLDRLGPLDEILRSAAAVDAEAATLREDIQQRQRKEAMRTVVGWVAARGPLKEGLTEENAAAIVWTLTSPEVHAMLGSTWGWPTDEYGHWLAETLIATLLPSVP